MDNYQIKIKPSAKGDLKKIKRSPLEKSFLEVIRQLRENPYEPNQSFEKLVPPADGKYSRRINVQHRVVYTINEDEKTVTIRAAWSHYE